MADETTKDTIKELLVAFLKKNRAYTAFIRYLDEKEITIEDALENANKYALNFIDASIKWSQTKEGFEFWEKINKDWKEHLKSHNMVVKKAKNKEVPYPSIGHQVKLMSGDYGLMIEVNGELYIKCNKEIMSMSDYKEDLTHDRFPVDNIIGIYAIDKKLDLEFPGRSRLLWERPSKADEVEEEEEKDPDVIFELPVTKEDFRILVKIQQIVDSEDESVVMNLIKGIELPTYNSFVNKIWEHQKAVSVK